MVQYIYKIFQNISNPTKKLCNDMETKLLKCSENFESNKSLLKLVLQWLAIIGKFNKMLNNDQNVENLLQVVFNMLLLKDDW